MFLKKSDDEAGAWVVMHDKHTSAGRVRPGRREVWGEQYWRGTTFDGSAVCDDASDRDDAARRVHDAWLQDRQQDADNEAAADAAVTDNEKAANAQPKPVRGRPPIGPRQDVRFQPELLARVQAAAEPEESFADTVRRLVRKGLDATD